MSRQVKMRREVRNVRALTLSILENKNLTPLPGCVEGGALPALVSGLGPINRAHLAAALGEKCGRPLCVIAPDETAAQTLAADLASFLERPVVTVAGREFTFYAAEGVSRQTEQRRIRALDELSGEEPPAAVIAVQALLGRTMPPQALRRAAWNSGAMI